MYAAAWEFEANSNPNAARALLQQGLRMCRHSQKMWLDYFDLVSPAGSSSSSSSSGGGSGSSSSSSSVSMLMVPL